MNRRQFIGSAAVFGVACSAGCLGYELVRESEKEARISSISTLEEDVDSLETIAEERAQELETVRDELESTISEVERVTARKVAVGYEFGIGAVERADGDYGEAVDQWDSGNYLSAAVWFEGGFVGYDEAANAFELAQSLADEQGSADASAEASVAEDYATAMREACNSFGLAAVHFYEGRQGSGEYHYERGVAQIDEANSFDYIGLNEFEALV